MDAETRKKRYDDVMCGYVTDPKFRETLNRIVAVEMSKTINQHDAEPELAAYWVDIGGSE